MTHDDRPPRPVPPPRPSLERDPARGAARDPIPKPPSEGSGTRGRSEASGARDRDGLTLRERQDLAEAATRRALEDLARIVRAQTNAEVAAEADRLELAELRRQAAQSRIDLRARDTTIDLTKRRLWAAVISLAIAVATWAAREITTNEVETKATTAAEHVVEERAAPIEERAEAAAVTATTNDARQTAAEAKALAREAEREAKLDALIDALEADVASRTKRGGR